MRDCQDNSLPISSNPCIVYTGQSIPEVGLINGQCYPLNEVFNRLWLWIQIILGGGSVTTTTTSTTFTSSSTTTTSTTAVFYDTQLTFSSSTTDFEEGVNGQALAINPILRFEFNAIAVPIGLYNVMNISVASIAVLQITYRTDYVGLPFRFTHTNGVQYTNTFGPDKNF